jgi:hypothetical protein
MKRVSFALLIAISSLVGCAVSPAEEEAPIAETASAVKVNCAAVLCAAVVCGDGEITKVPPGQCCPVCVKVGKAHDCRSKGCGADQYCGECRTTSGTAFVCLANGSAC